MMKRIFQKIPLELMILLIVVATFVAVRLIRGSKDERCEDICTMLRHDTIAVTWDGCVCEDPKTGDRDFHSFGKY